MWRLAGWLLAALASAALTVLAFAPADWAAVLLEKQTVGRLTLGDPQGTLWRGSAFIGGAASSADSIAPLLPGRFSWRLSPMVLLGNVDVELENAEALSEPVRITGRWHQLEVSHAAIQLPAERLAALGAPLNTVQPSGQMRLSWGPLQLAQQEGKFEMTGTMSLEMNGIASRMSPVRPLGSYNLTLEWRGPQAMATLKTTEGPLLLSGTGTFANGRLRFSGAAEAEAGQEERLANFLNLLGQRRKEGDREFIALEFK